MPHCAHSVARTDNIDGDPSIWTGKQSERQGTPKVVYQKHGAINLETQNFPNAINTRGFPSPVLRPGERYHHVAVHSFELGF